MFKKCNTTVLPAIVHPTKCCVNHHNQNFIVPEIHPSHTTNVNHQHFTHEHYFPHTESVVNEVSTSNVIMPGPGPGFGAGPAMGPGMVPGTMPMGGFGPRPRPGFGFR